VYKIIPKIERCEAMPIRIITDSSADLPKALLEQNHIETVFLQVHFGEERYEPKDEPGHFYHTMREKRILPKTSSPSPHDFSEVMERTADEDILVITVSSGLSSTYQHAEMAKEQLLDEGFAGAIEVLDSRTASLGLGIIVYQAAQMAKQGMPFEELVAEVRRLIHRTKTHFMLETLENVIKGGRLDRARGAIASVLNIKLLMHASEEGKVEVTDKVRGSKAAIQKLLDKLESVKHELSDRVIGIAHSDNESAALEVLSTLKKRYQFREAVVSEMGPVIGTYAGEGGILVAF
jgi:DegV family protein with EDD domain